MTRSEYISEEIQFGKKELIKLVKMQKRDKNE